MFLDLLKQELGQPKDAGGESRLQCPFCGERKYKFYVSKNKGLWICFKCSETGNPVTFVEKYYNVSFPEAADILATFDYDVNEGGGNEGLKQYSNLNELSEEEKLFLYISRQGKPLEEGIGTEVDLELSCPPPPSNCKSLINNFNNPEAFPFFRYLHRRGVSLDQIKEHNISYVTHGTIKLVDGRELDLHNHLVFYTFDDKGNPLYWNTRSIEGNPFIKSFNAPSRDNENSKNNVVFNLNNAKKTDKIVVTESIFDAITVGESGVATFGKKVTSQQIKILIEAGNHYQVPIYLFLDNDAGNEVKKTIEELEDKGLGTSLYLVVNPTDEDANDLGTEACRNLIHNAVHADAEGTLMFDLNNVL